MSNNDAEYHVTHYYSRTPDPKGWIQTIFITQKEGDENFYLGQSDDKISLETIKRDIDTGVLKAVTPSLIRKGETLWITSEQDIGIASSTEPLTAGLNIIDRDNVCVTESKATVEHKPSSDTRLAEALIRLDRSTQRFGDNFSVGYYPNVSAPENNTIGVLQRCVPFNTGSDFTPPATKEALTSYCATLKKYDLIAEQGCQISDPNFASTLSTQLHLQSVSSIEESLQKIEAQIQVNNTETYRLSAEEMYKKVDVAGINNLLSNLSGVKKQLNPDSDPDTEHMLKDLRDKLTNCVTFIDTLNPLPTNQIETTGQHVGRIDEHEWARSVNNMG